MHDYYSYRLPSTFNNLFKSSNKVHQYATRLASKKSYYLPKLRTNYGKFNIRFSGAKLWNAVKEDLKSAGRFRFKKLLKESVISKYWLVCYMQLIVCTAIVLSCFFFCSFVYLFIYYSLHISSLCVFVCIWLLITTLISSYFSAWLSHSAWLALAISEWLCSLFFTIISF